jgi:hypothetical protein
MDVAAIFDIYAMQSPATSTSSIVSSDEFVRQAEAKSGAYLPLRPCAPQWDFSAVEETRAVAVVWPGHPVVPNSFELTGSVDLMLRGWSISTELFEGLDYRATLRIKRREGLEFVPAPLSLYSPFSTPALPEDLRAKQVLMEYCRTQPHAYPADYNELGTMLTDILDGVSSALGSLGIPIVSPFASAANRALRGDDLGSVFTGLIGGLFG